MTARIPTQKEQELVKKLLDLYGGDSKKCLNEFKDNVTEYHKISEDSFIEARNK